MPFAPIRFSLNERTARRRGRYQRDTKLTQDTNINALGGIQNRGPGSEAAANLRLRPHDELAVGKFIFIDYFIFRECWPNSEGVCWHRKSFHVRGFALRIITYLGI
jgi:hypothetical protein